MSKHAAGGIPGLLRPSDLTGRKPTHPDAGRRVLSGVTLLITVLGLAGDQLVTYAALHSDQVDLFLLDHGTEVDRVLRWLWWAAVVILTSVAVSLVVRLPWRIWRWRLALQRFGGTYHHVVMPQPAGRSATSRTPDAPYVFWDRLLTTVKNASRKQSQAYLAMELWGNRSGRVAWGYYVPSVLATERVALRRLIIAERPKARVVELPDPLEAALERNPDDPEDTGERWFAGAVLTHAAPDYLPLPTDGLAMATLVSALRPPLDVIASGAALIAAPAPSAWALRVAQLVRRWQWATRAHRRHDEEWKDEVDQISLKAKQKHARMCVRVQVIATTRAAAERECQEIVAALTGNEQRFRHRTQRLAPRHRVCLHVRSAANATAAGQALARSLHQSEPANVAGTAQPARIKATTSAIPQAFRFRAPLPAYLRKLLILPFFPL